jgi:cytochrome c553
MLREILKQEIDTLSESQLKKIAEMIASLKPRSQESTKITPFWQSATPLRAS